jgi:hypothetical protein
MFSVMRSSGETVSFLFFVTWLVVGKYILLSLFLAVIMEAFEVAHDRQLNDTLDVNKSAALLATSA